MCATKFRPRKPLAPVSVEPRWLADAENGLRQFALGERVYELEALPEGYRVYTLRNGAVQCYDIDPTPAYGWQCDCPDATYRGERPGGCKHVRALKQLLQKLQQAA